MKAQRISLAVGSISLLVLLILKMSHAIHGDAMLAAKVTLDPLAVAAYITSLYFSRVRRNRRHSTDSRANRTSGS